MRFEELGKKHQDLLMYCLSDYIKGKCITRFIRAT
jgi:hypothetical protein